MKKEEALQELRGFIGQLTEGCQEAIKVLIPELKESEDERIRKAIVEFFKLQDDNTTYSVIPKKSILNWLEKQKEPIEGIKGNSEEIPSNVDLEKEIDEWLKAGPITDTRYDDYCDDDIQATARHFYELGLKARKEK